MTEKDLKEEVTRLRQLNVNKNAIINQLQTQIGHLKVEREELKNKLRDAR